MDVSLLPRFFKELTAKEVSQVMQGIFHKDKERFRICAEILPKIATVPSNSSDDEELTRYLDDLIRRNADDIQRPYLRFYQEVAESLEEDATEMLVAGLASDERVSAYVSNHVVTFSILTSFNDAQLRELIQDFTAAEVTALAAGLDAELRMRILNTLEGVRATVVKEDVDRLIESGQSFVDRAFKQIKAKTIAKIKNMKQSGLLDNNEQGRDKSAPFKFAA